MPRPVRRPNWNTVRYMISTIQYGGRITDDYDRLLMDTYADCFYHPVGTSLWAGRLGLGGIWQQLG